MERAKESLFRFMPWFGERVWEKMDLRRMFEVTVTDHSVSEARLTGAGV